jgi:hypothetical protein
MKKTNKRFDEIEQQLQKAHLAEPTDELKARILGAARETWKKEPAEVPWRIPLRRLGLSAVAALLIVSCANYFSTQAVAPWQAGRPVAARIVAADLEDTPEMPYNPFVRQLIATCGTSARGTSALLDYLQSVQETVNGVEPDDAAEGPGPEEQESLKGKIGIREHWNGGIVAALGHPEPQHSISPAFHHSLLAEGVAPCIDEPRES